MTFAEAKEFCSKLSYKPGSSFVFDICRDANAYKFNIGLMVTDASHQIEQTMIRYTSKMNPENLARMTKDSFLMLIRKELINMETHEVDEFFRYDHKHVTEPHPL